jgi:hypothetical protein
MNLFKEYPMKINGIDIAATLDGRQLHILADGGERTSGGYSFSVSSETKGTDFEVTVVFNQPGLGSITTSVMTYPRLDKTLDVPEGLTMAVVTFEGTTVASILV